MQPVRGRRAVVGRRQVGRRAGDDDSAGAGESVPDAAVAARAAGPLHERRRATLPRQQQSQPHCQQQPQPRGGRGPVRGRTQGVAAAAAGARCRAHHAPPPAHRVAQGGAPHHNRGRAAAPRTHRHCWRRGRRRPRARLTTLTIPSS